MMVGPWHLLTAQLLRDAFRKLWPETERVNSMRKDMAAFDRGIEVIVQIVDVHVAIAETPSWRNVEVSNDLIDSEPAFYAASLLSLSIQSLSVVFALTLLNVLTSSEGP